MRGGRGVDLGRVAGSGDHLLIITILTQQLAVTVLLPLCFAGSAAYQHVLCVDLYLAVICSLLARNA